MKIFVCLLALASCESKRTRCESEGGHIVETNCRLQFECNPTCYRIGDVCFDYSDGGFCPFGPPVEREKCDEVCLPPVAGSDEPKYRFAAP